MAFISISSLTNHTGVRKGRNPNGTNGLLFSIDKAGKNSERSSIRFRIGTDLVKEYRLIAGDRVDVLFDPVDKTGLIKRVASGGWAVGTSFKSKDKNKVAPLTVKLMHKDGMPWIDASDDCSSVCVTHEGILFSFPAKTIFTSYGDV